MSKGFKYSLEKWNFKKNTFYGSVIYRSTYDLSDIILNEGFPLTVKELKILETRVSETILTLLSEGHSINFWNLLLLQPVIKGIFMGKEDTFDPMRHSVQTAVLPSFQLKEIHRIEIFKIRKVDGYRRYNCKTGYIYEQ